MNCDAVRAWLRADLDGADEPSSEAAAHLEHCPRCAAEAKKARDFAEAAREALPAPAVPADFADRVQAAVGGRDPDAALLEAARGRGRRWLLLLAAGLLVPGILLLPRPRPLDLEEGAFFAANGWEGYALGRARFHPGPPPVLREGSFLAESAGPAVLETSLATITLAGGTRLVAMLAGREEQEMLGLNYFGSTALVVCVLAGSASVANAQGAMEADREHPAAARPGMPPELAERILHRLEMLEERVARIEGKTKGEPGPGIDRLVAAARKGDANARAKLLAMRKEIDRALVAGPDAEVVAETREEKVLRTKLSGGPEVEATFLRGRVKELRENLADAEKRGAERDAAEARERIEQCVGAIAVYEEAMECLGAAKEAAEAGNAKLAEAHRAVAEARLAQAREALARARIHDAEAPERRRDRERERDRVDRMAAEAARVEAAQREAAMRDRAARIEALRRQMKDLEEQLARLRKESEPR